MIARLCPSVTRIEMPENPLWIPGCEEIDPDQLRENISLAGREAAQRGRHTDGNQTVRGTGVHNSMHRRCRNPSRHESEPGNVRNHQSGFQHTRATSCFAKPSESIDEHSSLPVAKEGPAPPECRWTTHKRKWGRQQPTESPTGYHRRVLNAHSGESVCPGPRRGSSRASRVPAIRSCPRQRSGL